MLIGLVVIAFPKLLPQSEILNSDWFGENSQWDLQYHSTVAVAIPYIKAPKYVCINHGDQRFIQLEIIINII